MNTRNGELILELGDVHDNANALACALRVGRDDPQRGLELLHELSGHIKKTQEASSVAFVQPKVLQAIAILTGH